MESNQRATELECPYVWWEVVRPGLILGHPVVLSWATSRERAERYVERLESLNPDVRYSVRRRRSSVG